MQVSALTNLNAGRGAAYILRKVFQTNPMAQANQVMIARSFSFKDGSDRAFLCRSYQDSDDVTGTARPWVGMNNSLGGKLPLAGWTRRFGLWVEVVTIILLLQPKACLVWICTTYCE